MMYKKGVIKLDSNRIVLLLIYFISFMLLGYILGMFRGWTTGEVFLSVVVGTLILVSFKKLLFTFE